MGNKTFYWDGHINFLFCVFSVDSELGDRIGFTVNFPLLDGYGYIYVGPEEDTLSYCLFTCCWQICYFK